MDAIGIAALITAIMGALATAIGGAIAAWKYAKAQAKEEWLREQSAKTIRELVKANADLTAGNAKLEAENARLWSMVPEPEKSP